MAYTRVYNSRINWENYPSKKTPIDEGNLNKMDRALYVHDEKLLNLDTTKSNKSDLNQSLKSVTYNASNGKFVFTYWNGNKLNVDLNVEKIPVSFSMSSAGIITMTNSDGTKYTANVGALIKTYTFKDSSEINFTTTTDSSGNKTVTADIVNGSITGNKLQPNFLADCRSAKEGAELAAESAQHSAEAIEVYEYDSEAWAIGKRGGIDVPAEDETYENNSKYYADLAKQYKDAAAAVAGVDIATTTKAGLVMPDGETISVRVDGKITAGISESEWTQLQTLWAI